jgi:hypothetical protein
MPMPNRSHPRPLLQALWNQRLPGLFITGPAISVLLVDLVFGLPHNLQTMAIVMFVFTLALFSILLGGEYRALRHKPNRR